MKFIFATLLCLSGARAAQYPALYPFDNEANPPAEPHAASPTYTFDEQDTGGYVYTHAFKLEITDELLPTCFFENGMIMHQLVVRQGAPPVLPESFWNCTAKGYIITPEMYFNKIADQTICPENNCCKGTWGLTTLFQAGICDACYQQISQGFTDGLCDEMFGEEVYCLMFNNGHNFGCNEQNISPSDRQYLYACYDAVYHHYMGCKLYQVDGYKYREPTEPTQYFEASTAAEVNAWNGLYWNGDRVCHPYSYYYPEQAGSGGSESSADPSADSSSPSSYYALFVAVFIVSLLY